MEFNDTYRHQGLRKQLVQSLRERNIHDEKVLEAIGNVPRHLFMDSSFVEYAYQDKAFPISSGQTISQPYTVAIQTELLQLQKGMKVLEVGTGSGYQACILNEMGAKVFSVERQFNLYKKVKQFFDKYGYNIKVFFKDGYEGLASYAPFDRILITAAVPEIPEMLKQQLKVGGIMVAPAGQTGYQVMMKIIKEAQDQYREETHGVFVFVPMLPGKAED